MLTTWDEFLPYIASEATGAPSDLMQQTLVERCAHFCERTQLWRADLDAETTEANEPIYDLILPAVVEAVLWLRMEGTDLQHVSDLQVDPEYFSKTGKPLAFSIELDRQIRFYPTPDAAYSYTGRVVLKPGLDSRGVEQSLFNAHGRTIASGALAILLSMPEKTWTNLPMAAVHEQRFERGIARARVRDLRNIPLRVRPQYF